MAEPAYTGPAILALRGRVDVVADERRTINGATFGIRFADGRSETVEVDPFRGAATNPLSDDELSAVFRSAAAGMIPDAQAGAVLAALWSLDAAPDVGGLVSATLPRR